MVLKPMLVLGVLLWWPPLEGAVVLADQAPNTDPADLAPNTRPADVAPNTSPADLVPNIGSTGHDVGQTDHGEKDRLVRRQLDKCHLTYLSEDQGNCSLVRTPVHLVLGGMDLLVLQPHLPNTISVPFRFECLFLNSYFKAAKKYLNFFFLIKNCLYYFLKIWPKHTRTK